MAGDWIKMRIDLQSHPKVVRILSATQSDKFRVIGGLHAVWSVFDTHSEDGKLCGYTPFALDHVIGWDGFSAAMISVGWLTLDGSDVLQMPEFIEHNGKSGKRRAEDQKRKRDTRKSPQLVRNLSESDEDKKRTREEKRRYKENIKRNLPDDFVISEANKRFATENKLSLESEFQQFVNHHASNGKTFVDWNAALRTWLGNAVKFSGGKQSGNADDWRKDLV